MSSGNGSERLDPHGGRRLTIPGIGLVELVQDENGKIERVITTEPLSIEQKERLVQWLRDEWHARTN